MASWPTAIKSDVEGYIVIMLAPTCHNGISNSSRAIFFRVLYLRSKCEVPKYSDDLICDDRGTNGPSDDNVHSFLSVMNDLVIEREKLEKKSLIDKNSPIQQSAHILRTGERKHLNWKS